MKINPNQTSFVCVKCNAEKSLSEFYTYKIYNGTVHRRTECKICSRKRVSDWEINNKERYSDRKRLYKLGVRFPKKKFTFTPKTLRGFQPTREGLIQARVEYHTERPESVTSEDPKTINLRNGMQAIVDAQDFAYLSKWSWTGKAGSNQGRKGSYYVYRYDKPKGNPILMHRLVCAPSENQFVDHKNRNTLDNRSCNLRPCTHSQNQANRGKVKNCSSIYKGVIFTQNKWKALVTHQRKRHYLGLFKTEIEAAMAYDKKALELFGDFASLNCPSQPVHPTETASPKDD